MTEYYRLVAVPSDPSKWWLMPHLFPSAEDARDYVTRKFRRYRKWRHVHIYDDTDREVMRGEIELSGAWAFRDVTG